MEKQETISMWLFKMFIKLYLLPVPWTTIIFLWKCFNLKCPTGFAGNHSNISKEKVLKKTTLGVKFAALVAAAEISIFQFLFAGQ